jgi:hypothetical protein
MWVESTRHTAGALYPDWGRPASAPHSFRSSPVAAESTDRPTAHLPVQRPVSASLPGAMSTVSPSPASTAFS